MITQRCVTCPSPLLDSEYSYSSSGSIDKSIGNTTLLLRIFIMKIVEYIFDLLVTTGSGVIQIVMIDYKLCFSFVSAGGWGMLNHFREAVCFEGGKAPLGIASVIK